MQAKCNGCGRHPRECWVMPCLLLEMALSEGTRAVKQWGQACGLVLREDNNE
jgi:hypothetical protein